MSYVFENLPISNIDKSILQTIAKKGERTYYALWRKDKVAASNKTVQVALKRLEQRAFIKPKKKTEGTEKKPYVLTFRGLIAVLLQRESLKCIDQIAKEQRKLLPLIFGKWRHFHKCGVDGKLLANMLKWFCHMVWQRNLERAEFGMQEFFFYVFNMTLPEEKIRWLRAIHDDSELKKWAFEEEFSFRRYAAMMVWTFRLIRESKPDWDKALAGLRRINRMPISKEISENLERERKEQLEEFADEQRE